MKHNRTKGKTDSPKLFFPVLPVQEIRRSQPRQVHSEEYFAIAKGESKIYTVEDGIEGDGNGSIGDPAKASYINLFINGILQPKTNYEVSEGKLILKTDDVPPDGTPIILQMVTF
ncbi:DUF4183 domain-containing protein [Metabacillus lacus]|uniref:DUF4183 domain-containing protein n=1 Tax=Metabacillus lacus TaxID=1983721 RepID=UPI0031B5C5A6